MSNKAPTQWIEECLSSGNTTCNARNAEFTPFEKHESVALLVCGMCVLESFSLSSSLLLFVFFVLCCCCYCRFWLCQTHAHLVISSSRLSRSWSFVGCACKTIHWYSYTSVPRPRSESGSFPHERCDSASLLSSSSYHFRTRAPPRACGTSRSREFLCFDACCECMLVRVRYVSRFFCLTSFLLSFSSSSSLLLSCSSSMFAPIIVGILLIFLGYAFQPPALAGWLKRLMFAAIGYGVGYVLFL